MTKAIITEYSKNMNRKIGSMEIYRVLQAIRSLDERSIKAVSDFISEEIRIQEAGKKTKFTIVNRS